MKKYSREIIGINELKDIETYISDSSVVELHFLGVLFGITVYRDRERGLCIADHTSITCTSSIEEAKKLLREKLGKYMKEEGTMRLVLYRRAGK